jgi:hypothetical protein
MDQKDMIYQSQFNWLQERMARKGRTKPSHLAGQQVNLSEPLRTHLESAAEDLPGMQLCFWVFLAECRLFREFCKYQRPCPSILLTSREDVADCILGAEDENIFPGLLLEAPSSLPPASGQILLPALRHPPRDGVNSVTGLPFGARIFRHPDAYPMMSGENMTYIKKFNDNFPVLRVRFERLPGLGVAVWVEVKRGLAATPENLEARDACMSGLINYIGTPDNKVLPNIVDFYRMNFLLFYPV